MVECMYCNEEVANPLAHLAECPLAPQEAREEASSIVESRKQYAAQETCCDLRKKIFLKPVMLPKEVCGVDDIAIVDVMTFDKFHGKDVVCPRFCPWCGAPWIVRGIKVL